MYLAQVQTYKCESYADPESPLGSALLQVCEAAEPAGESAAPQGEGPAGPKPVKQEPLHLFAHRHAQPWRRAQ